jgi:integrase/recombinase XerD
MTSLRRRMTEDMQVRSLSPQTQATYVQQVSLFARHFNKSPELLGPEDIRSYQLYLTNERKLAPSSIILAVAALRFLYKITLHKDWSLTEVIPTPKKPQKLPIVPSPEEVLQFLGCVWNIKHRTILTTCYAAGLRVSEAVCLKVTDIDSKRMVIRVEQGKGRIDRYVMLSPKLHQILRDWWRVDRPQRWLFPGDQVDNHIGKCTIEEVGVADLPNRLHLIPCGTRSPFICWNRAPTCARSSCCWVIAASLPQPPISASPIPRCALPRARLICFPKRSALS